MKNKIYIKHWLALKPEHYSSNTDIYYLKIANKINNNFNTIISLSLSQFLSKDDKAVFCCFLASYFEDIISNLNIWQSFKLMHKELYKKPLPFYDIDQDYIDEEINFEDIAFLTWYYLNTIQDNQFISPYNDFILDIATVTMQVLDEEYEYAPENNILKSLYKFENSDEDFNKTRAFMQFVFFESYLFYTDTKYELDQEYLKTIEENKEEAPETVLGYIREITEDFTFNKTSSLLAVNAKDWAKNILGKNHKSYQNISGISQKISGLFLYKKQNPSSVFIEHIASGMPFEMTKKSFDHHERLEEDEILYIGLANYKSEWWFTGNFILQEFDADTILDQKNSAEARTEVNFLEDQNKFKEILNKQEKGFLKFNNGAHFAFLKSGDIEKFVSDYMEFYNNQLAPEPESIENAKQRARDEGYFAKVSNIEIKDDLVVIFFNPKNGIEIYNDILDAFPDEKNPFFIEENSKDIMHILLSPKYSTEFVNCFIKTYNSKLSFFKKEPFKSYLNDLDFLLRFWKKDNYKTKSTLVLTGKGDKTDV